MKVFSFAFLLCCAGLSTSAQNLRPVLLSDGRFEYRDAGTGAAVFSTTFETATPFRNGFAVVSNQHRYAVINSAGEPVSETRWVEISPATGGYAIAFSKAGERALLHGGKKVFETKSRLMGAPSPEGLMPFQAPQTGKMGLISIHTGKEVLPAQFDHLRPLSEGIAAALDGNGWHFVDLSGKAVSAQQYEGAEAFSGGLAAVRRHGKWGFVNKKEDWVIPAQYDRVTAFTDGTAFAQRGESWQQIDPAGKVIRELPYQMVIPPTEGLYAFMQHNLWGFAEAATGKVVIAPQYLRAAAFENGLAFVVKDGQRFYILPDGTELRAGK